MDSDKMLPQLSAIILEEQMALTLAELSHACAVPAEFIVELVGEGVIAPLGREPHRWRFSGTHLRHTASPPPGDQLPSIGKARFCADPPGSGSTTCSLLMKSLSISSCSSAWKPASSCARRQPSTRSCVTSNSAGPLMQPILRWPSSTRWRTALEAPSRLLTLTRSARAPGTRRQAGPLPCWGQF